MGNNYQEALEIMCHRCVNHEACQGTGCTPKKDIKKLVDKATPRNPILVTHGKVKMTAKEMFEELGYKCKENDNQIEYTKDFERYFIFNKLLKKISIGAYDISLKELGLINKQCKELGWI